MADHQERFEPYHVPQQSRRDKLRILSQNQHSGALGLLQQPIYDPTTSLISSSSDLLTQSVKAEAANLMGFTNHHLYNMDPPQSSSSLSSIQLNPNPIHDINGNPFLYNPQLGLRFLHHHEETTRCGGVGLGLSLSLSSLPRELYSNSGGCFGNSNELARNSVVVPFGPFIGYASVLKGSRFLKPAQMLLEELCDLGRGIYSEKMVDDSGLMDPSLESFVDDDPQSCTSGGDQRRKKSRLMSMLHEVYKRYKQYYQQMQAVVASFESVAGVRNAAPFANLAVKAMFKHFRFLKNAITDQLQFVTESRGHIALEKDTITGFENPVMGIQNQRQLQNVGFVEHQPVWRPQRGLPERAVTVLRQWLFEHFLHPYPSDTDKIMLAKQTGLSRNQVSNWFINARVRLWKPMVEEIHLLETRQAQKEAQNTERQSNAMLASNPVSCDKKVISSRRLEDFPSKRTRNDFSAIPSGNEGAMNLPCDNSPRHPCFSVGINTAGGSGSVSLTLGLQQNNGIGLPDTFPINAARRFGLDSSGDGFVMGGIDAQNRQFGRGILEGQILHDFVG